jgi:hypothetical protein
MQHSMVIKAAWPCDSLTTAMPTLPKISADTVTRVGWAKVLAGKRKPAWVPLTRTVVALPGLTNTVLITVPGGGRTGDGTPAGEGCIMCPLVNSQS